MSKASPPAPLPSLSRRRFVGASATIVALGGCNYYRPGSGAAYEPWDFPTSDLPPHLQLVHAALLAASPHNTQPWIFKVDEQRIEIWADRSRSLGAMDPLEREMLIGLGCALENLLIAAQEVGFATEVDDKPAPDTADRVATVHLSAAAPQPHRFFDVLAQRHTNRTGYADLPLAEGIEDELQRLLEDLQPARLVLLTDRDERASFRSGTISATEAILSDDEMATADHAWFRHTLDEVTEHRDGITIDTAGLGAGVRFLGKSGRKVSKKRSGEFWLNATEGRHTTGSAFGLLVTPTLEQPPQLLAVGRAWQRIQLWLVDERLGGHPLNQVAERRDRELQKSLEPKFGEWLGRWSDNEHAQMLFRIGYPWDRAYASPRRPVDWVTQEVDA